MSVNVEHIIKEIISIDKDAENHKSELKQSLDNKKAELQETIAALQKDCDRNLNLKKKEVMELKVKEAESVIEQVNNEKDIALNKLKEGYERVREEILKDVLDKLINSETSCC